MSSPSKKRRKKISCKKCGFVINPAENPPDKTWQLISPMPDKEGRVTLTIMGSFRCPDCNASVRAALKKVKGDEEFGKSKKELLIEAINLIEGPTPIEQIEIAGISAGAVNKAIQTLINQGNLKGRIEKGIFYPQ
ncbi:MAG: hypothetical protein ACFFAJ_03630 [Candidatus Hodarchaeota archaeon]